MSRRIETILAAALVLITAVLVLIAKYQWHLI
jgi:hypothetical protein